MARRSVELTLIVSPYLRRVRLRRSPAMRMRYPCRLTCLPQKAETASWIVTTLTGLA